MSQSFEGYAISPKVIEAYMLNFNAIFDHFLKICWGDLRPLWGVH